VFNPSLTQIDSLLVYMALVGDCWTLWLKLAFFHTYSLPHIGELEVPLWGFYYSLFLGLVEFHWA